MGPTRTPQQAAAALDRALGDLTTTAVRAMESELSWFADLSAEHRSSIGAVAHGGIRSFIEWLRHPDDRESLVPDVFDLAPEVLARVVSLQQTVAMVRVTIDAVERDAVRICGPDDGRIVLDAISRFGREIAFAAAEVYARAAESRGAWDARLEALVVDSVLRGDADEVVRSRASALGWDTSRGVAVIVGATPPAPVGGETVVDDVHRATRHRDLEALCAVQGDRVVVFVGGVTDETDLADTAGAIARHLGPGPVVVGPSVPDLMSVTASARAALAGFRAAPGWPGAPRPVAADDLLPERALAGDGHARRTLVADVHRPLTAGDATLLRTVVAYLEAGASVEETARRLIVHGNTVRYRLRRVAEITGLDATRPRDAFTLHVATTLGHLNRNSD